jgi:uncharacterized membrane protein YqhA
MADRITPESWLDLTKKTWGLLVELAVFIFGIIGTFLVPPPGWTTSTGDATLVRLGQFIIAVLAGLFLLLAAKWKHRKHVSRWAITCVVCLLLSVLAYFGYQKLKDARTCEYAQQEVIIGTDYTTHGREYLQNNPTATCQSLLEDFVGKADDIWTKDSINASRFILAGTYIGIIPLFTICIMSLVQALYCRGKSKS